MEENNRRAEAKIKELEELLAQYDNYEIETDEQFIHRVREILKEN